MQNYKEVISSFVLSTKKVIYDIWQEQHVVPKMIKSQSAEESR
jgi:hypothetical protein